jgi:phenylpropionate dioxygenase-like ring-hydroxylating dioxygenase large terminal subunit
MDNATQPKVTKRPDVPEIAKGVPKGLEFGLRNYWYPVIESEKVKADEPTSFVMLGEALVAWRDRAGRPCVVRDKCPHRAAKLSQGRVLGGDLQCRWHGLRFDGAGRCTLIPWEPNDSKLLAEAGVVGYPAKEVGGQIWAYLGDSNQFPVPPLEDCLPEELTRPDEFITFRHPDEVWNCNWLQAFDGVDLFHAVMLHSNSQAVQREAYKGSGRPQQASVSIEDRRMSIVETPQGLRGVVYDPTGEQIHHGHILSGWDGQSVTLPALNSVPIRPAPGVPPYLGRHYQLPIDATHTLSVRFVSMRAQTAEERARCETIFRDVIAPRQRQVNDEDREIIEELGDLAESRSEEYLFYPDREVVQVRRMFADAFVGQSEGRRPLPAKKDLAVPDLIT